MSHTLVRKISFATLVIVLTVSAGYLGGVVLAERIKDTRFKKQREIKTIAVLEAMGTGLSVRDTLPDYTFETPDGDPVALSDLVSKKTILMFAQPDCPKCIDELVALGDVAANPNSDVRIIIISSALPHEFESQTASFANYRHFLFDRADSYADRLGVFTFPFNIAVRQGLIVCGITAGTMDEEFMSQLVEHGK